MCTITSTLQQDASAIQKASNVHNATDDGLVPVRQTSIHKVIPNLELNESTLVSNLFIPASYAEHYRFVNQLRLCSYVWSVLGENYMSDRMNYWRNTSMYLLRIVRHFNHSATLEDVMKDRQVNINVDCMDLDWEDFAKQYPIDFGADDKGNPILFWTEGRVDVILKQIKNEFELMKKEDKATETIRKKSAKEYDDDYSPCPKPKKGQKKRTRNSIYADLLLKPRERKVMSPNILKMVPVKKSTPVHNTSSEEEDIVVELSELTPSSHSQEDDNDNAMDQDPSVNLFNGSRGDSELLKAFFNSTVDPDIDPDFDPDVVGEEDWPEEDHNEAKQIRE
ncbi:hypothetical protein JAAARDRAFT_49494 [Jaapia argillacea MUCL 33604]|uniref:Uncharacterized protein n=1 Tax=Jaapia argillacea MUCL 33604 TaxID=933084 RepID=A0A067PH17_9AGAM|nr:hypothetical protein JAAARDRAFT_49494 [Jaapia argillacea MUCL 33604]